jgi:putative redox protein
MEEKITFTNKEGEELVGSLHRPDDDTRYGVVLGHCFTCSRHTRILQRIGKDLASAGYMALRFDFSGNGQSQGEFTRSTFSKQISEVETAMELLKEQGVDWFGLAGHSMGAAIAILTGAGREDVNGVCAIAGRSRSPGAFKFLSEKQREELDRTGKVTFESRGRALALTDTFFSDADQYDLSRTIRRYPKPLLVVHGEADEIIPVSEARHAQEINPDGAELLIIPEADHMFMKEDHRRQVSERVVGWFDDIRTNNKRY